MQKNDKADAIAILGSYHHGMADIRDDGVWPSAAFVEGNVLDELGWNYASELDWPGSPNPLSTPSLPIPFSANELAAFMQAGIGVTIPVTYLDWNQGLDEDMFQLTHRKRRLIRTAKRDTGHDGAAGAQKHFPFPFVTAGIHKRHRPLYDLQDRQIGRCADLQGSMLWNAADHTCWSGGRHRDDFGH